MGTQNPFVDEEDDIKEQELEAKARAEKGEIEVPTDDEDDDGEQEEVEAAPKTRNEKRKSRWNEHTERAQRAEEDARAARAQLDQERAHTQKLILEQQNLLLNQQQGNQGREDPLDAEARTLRENQSMLFERYQHLQQQNAVTADLEREFRAKAERFQDRLSEIAAERVANRRAETARAQQPDQNTQAIRAHVQLHYPDVLGNKNHMTYADATYVQLIAKGEAPGIKTVNKALDATRRAFRLPGAVPDRPAPTATERRRFAGTEAGAGGKGGPTSTKAVVMDKPTQRMAREMYPGLEPKKAYQMWANRVGKKMQQKET